MHQRSHWLAERAFALSLIALALGMGGFACGSHRNGDASSHMRGGQGSGPIAGGPARGGSEHAGGAGAGGAGGAVDPGGSTARCGEVAATPAAAIASVPLTAALPLRLGETAQLRGDGLRQTLMPQQNVAAGLRWQHDRMLMLTDTGFWDIALDASVRWYATSSVLVLSANTADLDHDGDLDLLLLTADVDVTDDADAGASPLVTRLSVWERTPAGLAERAEVLRLPYVILPIPYEAGDLDGDGDMDVATYESGAPVGYIHDGAFGFTRTVLGATAPEYEDKLLALVRYSDRNKDGAPDLLVATGEALEISVFVLLGDGSGRFGAPGPATIVEATLVPHGPTGTGFWFADVTGDGLEDVVTQDAQSTDAAPILNLFVSETATRIAPAVQLEGLGFEFADVDADARMDIVSTRNGRLIALLSRGEGAFEPRDLGVSMAPPVKDFVVDPGQGGPPVLHVLYDLSACPSCAEGCSARCFFDTCVACLSDADCAAGRCKDQACAP